MYIKYFVIFFSLRKIIPKIISQIRETCKYFFFTQILHIPYLIAKRDFRADARASWPLVIIVEMSRIAEYLLGVRVELENILEKLYSEFKWLFDIYKARVVRVPQSILSWRERVFSLYYFSILIDSPLYNARWFILPFV